MSDYPNAINYFVSSNRVFANQNSHSAIVVHGTGGVATQTVEQLGEWFRTNGDLVSSHYGVGRDGRVAQYVLESDGAAANCCVESGYDPFWDQFGGDNLNVHTISIEHINDAANSLPLTDAQKEASFKLIAYLCDKYNLTSDQVKTHADIAPASRSRCPGVAFPLDELRAFLNGEGAMQTYSPDSGDFAQYFTLESNGNWICKLSNTVLLGDNLRLFQRLSMDGQTLPILGLPRTNEIYQKDSDGYSWSVQFFERGLIVYDPAHKRDGQPGLGDSYLGKYAQFQQYDPHYKIVLGIPAELKDEIQTNASLAATMAKIADSLPTT